MKKVASSFSSVVAVDKNTATPLHRQIYDSYRVAIEEGTLSPGDRVPSSRELANELALSRTPVFNAYAQLVSEGLFESRRGAGMFVSKTWFGWQIDLKKDQAAMSGLRTISRRASALPSFTAGYSWVYGQGAFAIGQVATELFPFHVWSRLVVRSFREAHSGTLHFGDPMGSPEFRKTLAAYLRTARAVKCEPEQIMVVNGSQQALDIAARVLFDPGSSVWIEEPGYPGVRHVLAMAGCKLVAVPVDREGLNVHAGIKLCPRARAAFVTPSHQCALGAIMTVARRRQLLAWAEDSAAWIIEDDYDSEYRYRAMPVPSLQGMDRNDRVIYMGTFSKTMFSTLRVGYMVIPRDLVDRFTAVRHAMDRFPPQLYQYALEQFIAAGHYARHIRRTRQVYQERRDALVDAITKEFGDGVEVLGAEAGLYVTLKLPKKVSDIEIVRRAAQDHLWLYPLSSCYIGHEKGQGLILGFANTSKREIPTAVRRLGKMLAATKS